MVVMAVSDVMTMNFFWMVKDEGSWLDIGTTISHFVIGSGLCIFVAGLEGVSEALISGIEVDSFDQRVKMEGVDTINNQKNVGDNSSASGKANGVVVNDRLVID